MKTWRMANAVGYIDDDLICEADESPSNAQEKQKEKKKKTMLRWGSFAAGFLVLIIVSAVIVPLLLSRDDSMTSDPTGDGDRYKDFTVSVQNVTVLFPWEARTEGEKYTLLDIEGVRYHGKGRKVSENLVGEYIGRYTATGYDETKEGGEWHTADFDAYTLAHIAQGQFVALRMEDGYYVFQNAEYAPPATLGELMQQVDLPAVIELSRFSEKDGTPDSDHFVLTDDDRIWQILSTCEDAPFVEDQGWSVGDRDYLSFTLTSESLGIYKVSMRITEDGYLWTNAFSWQYLFDIGEEAAGEIIRYAREHATPSVYEPYLQTVVGTVVGITDGYLVLDDSILCKDPDDGVTYRVPLDDIRLSRYVEYGVIGVGDTVQVSYKGELDAENGNVIADAVSLDKATIRDGDALIFE